MPKEGIQEIEVQGLIYETPVIPPLEGIRGYDLPVEDQVWHRRTEYEQWEWNIDSMDENKRPLKMWWETASPEQTKWYTEEIHRINFGDWIMINGEKTYMNKYCYFFHQWFYLQEGIHPTYRETSLEYFRFYQLCEDDPMTLGDCGIKGRRVGLSSMSASISLLIAILESNTLQGVVSKTGDDAYEMYLMIKNGLEKLPPFLMPELNKVTESEIHIAKPTKKISSNNKMVNADKGLNNRINHANTTENAYDGRRIRKVTIDEASKWKKINVQMTLSKISDTLVVGVAVGGHVSVFSTVDKGDDGGDNFRTIWDGSDHLGKLDQFGRTRTKLKRFFLAGFRGLNGYVGKYGESISETPTPEQTEFLKQWRDPITGVPCPNPHIGAIEFLQVNRKMLENDPELHADQVRKYPFKWQEVFEGVNNRCHFILSSLNDQISAIEEQLQELDKKEMGRRGRFVQMPNGCADWRDDNAGMWYILQFLPQ